MVIKLKTVDIGTDLKMYKNSELLNKAMAHDWSILLGIEHEATDILTCNKCFRLLYKIYGVAFFRFITKLYMRHYTNCDF